MNPIKVGYNLFYSSGLAQTSGIMRYKGRVAPSDSLPVESYRKAGGIPSTVTNVPEFCMWWESANHIFGMTKNPYDNRRTVGGSSGQCREKVIKKPLKMCFVKRA